MGLAVDWLGRFVYVTAYGTQNVFAYRMSRDGALTPVASSPFPTGVNPSSVAVDLLGRFDYVANQGTGRANSNVSAYRIGPHGALT